MNDPINLLSPRRARILIVNDDGPEAKGITTIARKLSEIGDVLVCLPFSAQIHPSFSITTNDTCTAIFREKQSSDRIQTWAVLRTPIDCVNFGTELLYSGTIAAAFGARFENSVPAIAISQEIPDNVDPENVNFDVAADVAQNLVE